MFRRAAEKGAQLALAPEGALDGYVVNEILDGRAQASRILDVAITVRHPVFRRFRRLAAELRMCLAFGFAERVGRDVYNAAAFLDHRGRLRGKYHKMQLAEGYRPSWWFDRLGERCRAFDTPLGRCAFLICNDRWNPDLARIAALDGAQCLLIPAFGSRSENQDRAVLARARENGLPVVEANVGVMLLISKGEIVKVSRHTGGITLGVISIPARPCLRLRDIQERRFMAWRRREMPRRVKPERRRDDWPRLD
jgi:N-carbamoylputrescine amidase